MIWYRTDWLTGQIANLYPDTNVLVTGYEQAGTADNAYDVVMIIPIQET